MDEQPDYREPTRERQAELAEGYARNQRNGAAFRERNFAIRTRGELDWLIRQQGWSGEIDDSPYERRISLCVVNFHRANLQGIHLYCAILEDSFFEDADLRGAILIGASLLDTSFAGANLDGAHLVGAYLPSAHLDGANLRHANLTFACLGSAGLRGVDMRNARLRGADLQGAHLSGADLRGADLRGCRINSKTELDEIITDGQTRWINGLPLSRGNSHGVE